MAIKTREEADNKGLEHLMTEAKIAELEARDAQKIQAIKEASKKEIDGLKAHDKKLLEELADWFWAQAERDEGTKGQLTLTHIKLTERKTTIFKYPSPLTKVITKAKQLALTQFVRTKEEVNKDKIRDEANADQLRALGIRIDEEVTVYVEQV